MDIWELVQELRRKFKSTPEITQPDWSHKFRLICKWKSDYWKVCVCSYDSATSEPSRVLTFYRSRSEGVWRLALERTEAEGEYYKGYDYITQTSVHVWLQRAIEMNWWTISTAPDEDWIRLESRYRALNETYVREFTDPDGDKREGYARSSRLYHSDVFHAMRWCMAGKCFGAGMVDRKDGDLVFKKGFVAEKMKELRELNTEPGEHMAVLLEAAQVRAEKRTGKAEISLSDIVDIYGAYMKKYFEIEPETKRWLLYTTQAQDSADRHDSKDPTALKMDVYQSCIREKATKQRFRVIFATYEYKHSDDPLRKYRIIQNVIPDRYKRPTKYGVYQKYVSMGVYIYKPFEYWTQAIVTHITTPMVNRSYRFLGHRLDNMWPINEITNIIDPVSDDKDPPCRDPQGIKLPPPIIIRWLFT